MESMPQSPTKSIRPRSRDTGFPTPFCGSGNTTLPHPDADTSPNASITAEDISVNKLIARSRRSFLAKNNRRTLSHGIITPEMERLHQQSTIEDTLAASERHQQSMGGRPSKDGTESLGRTDTSGTGDDEAPPAPQALAGGPAPGPSVDLRQPEIEKRRSVLRKLRLG